MAEPLSFEGLFEAEARTLFRRLCAVTGNSAKAEEIMQDAFLALWDRWDRVSTMQDPTGYLYRTAMTAPGPLRIVQDYVNTVDLEDGPDRFATEDGLHAWLLKRGLIDPQERLNPKDLRRALETRDALRALAMANNGHALDPSVAQSPNDVLAAAGLLIQFDRSGGATLAPARGGIDGALSQILAALYESMIEGTWPRLKACRRDVCHWVFYDHSRNRSGT